MFPILILASPSAPPLHLDRDRVAVRAVLHRFEAAWNDGDLEVMLKTYTDPHVDVNHPDQILGRDETRALLAAHHPGERYRIRILSDEIVVEGDMAFQRGSFVLTPTSGTTGDPPITKRYLEILRRGQDGEWRVWWAMDGPVGP